MPQFYVHRNPGRGRAAIPYVVVVQSSRPDELPTRLVVLLVLPRPPNRATRALRRS